ncbi:MAG: putative Na+/H+ antiporter [Verrucomicrobiota bacterium]
MRWFPAIFVLLVLVFATGVVQAAPGGGGPAAFPLPLDAFEDEGKPLMEQLKGRIAAFPFNLTATIIFFCAILHTFLAGVFVEWAHKHEEEHRQLIEKEGRTAAARPQDDAEDDVSFKSTLFHFLGEVEVVFGIWVLALAAAAYYHFDNGWAEFKNYVSGIDFTEPFFVVVIMALAASRPILRLAEKVLQQVARIGKGTPAAWWFSVLTFAPILGSFITEPAAMTIAALILAKKFYEEKPSAKFAYATLGLLFVNISVGGTLTNFAAPPVLMVAGPWDLSTPDMISRIGLKSILAIVIANILYAFIFRKELFGIKSAKGGDLSKPMFWRDRDDPVPYWITIIHVIFMVFVVANAHTPEVFIPAFLFFLAFVQSTKHHQNEIKIGGPLLVGFFLAGLKIHGDCQGWWVQPILTSGMPDLALMLGSTGLTAFNDNAAITYLASKANGLGAAAKYAVMAGAVAGGGLTVIANAPNPAGQSILQRYFEGGVSPLKLALGAAIPTAIVCFCLNLIPPFGFDAPVVDAAKAAGKAVAH